MEDYKKKHADEMREYYHSPKGNRSCMKSKWRGYGLKGDLDEIYDRYLATTHCDRCNHLLTSYKKGGRQKQMDHDHRTLEFRAVLCAKCNTSDTTRMMNKNQKYGHKGLTFVKSKGLWSYRKENSETNMKVKKMSKCKTTILCIKFAYLILLNYKLSQIKYRDQI